MPRGDGTGPNGDGPMTGRGAGYCTGSNVPGSLNPLQRLGLGLGRRRAPRNGGFLGLGLGLGRGRGGRGRRRR